MTVSTIRVLALDLEGTLISNAVSQIPRPGLFAFLEECLERFEHVVIFTAVSTERTRAILTRMDRDGEVPKGFGTQVPIVDWSGDFKDLRCVPYDVEPTACLLVDDLEAYVLEEQREQWVPIEPFSTPYPEDDTELARISHVLSTYALHPPPPDPNDVLAHYLALIDRVDAFSERVHTAWQHNMQCRLGCTACCRQDLAVSRLEADLLVSWLLDQPHLPTPDPTRTPHDQHPLFDTLSNHTPCVFLTHGGACGVYPVRPLICRTHGLPVQLDTGEVSACPLNFDGDPQTTVPPNDTLNLQTANTTLAVLNLQWTQACDLPEDSSASRIPLSSVRALVEAHRNTDDFEP